MAGLDWRQSFAAFAAAIAQRGASATGGFAGKEPVLPFPAHFLWLILAFHKFKCRPRLQRKTSSGA
jgi:hypothetical protein